MRNERGQFVKGTKPTNGFVKGHKRRLGIKHSDDVKKRMRFKKIEWYKKNGNTIGFKKGNKLWDNENAIMKPKRNHIDYNKKNCNPNNLISLCNSCHSKTNFDRKYWINYFLNI
jgi:hypothetical protein